MFKKLIDWSHREYSHLPWRKRRTLYKTLVSEIMLQQTTVQTVLNHYERFLKQFPTIEDLAKSTEEEMHIAWKGLGYYRRARNLRQAAIDICEQYNGKIPKDKEKLISISGIGEYTSCALMSIGSDKEFLAIDANLERVLSRIYGIQVKKGPALHKEIQRLFNEKEILKDRKKYSFRDLNEALMDLGRVYCRANKTSCDLCPVAGKCEALKQGNVLAFPMQPEKKKQKFYELELVKFIVQKNNKVLASKRAENEWLSGQVELPTFILKSEDKKLTQYPLLKKKTELKNAKILKSSITKYKIKNYLVEIGPEKFEEIKKMDHFKYFPLSEKNFTTTTIKALKKLHKL